jgi:hypothetical protein
LFLKTGLEAAVVGPGDRVRLRPVTVARDLGSSMEIASGLSPSDRIINNPPDSISDNQLVRVVDAGASDGGPGREARHAAR